MFSTSPSLTKSISFLFFCFLVISGLYFGREFLIPVAIAALFSMLFVPLSRWIESKGWNRTLSSLSCVLLLLLAFGLITALLSWQAADLAEDLSKIGDRISKISQNLQQFVARSIGISVEKQQEWLDKQSSSGGGSMNTAGKMASALMGMMVDAILVLVYIFLFLTLRNHLKKFILMLVPDTEKKETEKIIADSGKVAQRYLSGLSMMIGMLWVMYGIGFTLAGVENALFFAVLCGLLEIIPFIGNLTGTFLTLLMAISQGGDSSMIIAVLATYFTVQFIQTYIIEPFVVGSEVNINPLFTIMILVLMEIIWGIPGMVIAIPMLGIVKIVCDHVKPLKPYGFLIGQEKKESGKAISEAIKRIFGKKSG